MYLLATDTEGQYIPGTIVISAHQYSGEQRLEFALDDPTKARYVFERTLVYARDRGFDTANFFGRNQGTDPIDLQDEQF